ncbi:thiol reductant ABC exporter subunit CydC [Robbsia sp. KACC 23696]|uniref:thiol reductant ABC exporter subunit CydC n=1 Tax=Robbsia sp. KACC 23696 TaxID=3149231 RepID=UPI00325AA4C0
MKTQAMQARTQMNSNAATSWHVFWRVLTLFTPYRKRMVVGVLLSSVAAIAGIGLMGMSGWFLASMGLAGVAGVSMNYFVPAAVIRGAAIVRTVGRYAERLINHDVTLRVVSHLRVWLFRRLLPLAPARTGFLGHAALFSRLRADVDRLEHAYLAVLLPILVAAISLPLVTIVLACFVWPVAVVSVAMVLLVAVALPIWLARRSAAASVAVVELETTLRTLTSDALLGAAELRLYGGECRHAARIAALTSEHGRRRAQLDRLQAGGSAVVALAAQWTTIASFLLAARELDQHHLGAAQLSMVVLLALAQFDVLASLPEAISQLGATLVSAGRVFALIDATPAVEESSESGGLPMIDASRPAAVDIQFRDVWLRYPENTAASFGASDVGHAFAKHEAAGWALRGVNLDVPAGHRIAIVGPSGAGKSSLIGALLRFYPIQKGQIRVGDRAVDALAGDAVRELIAVVEQRTHIFNGTLLDNLLVARPDATTEQIRDVIVAAQLEPMLNSLPEGLHTWLGEGGVLLSGGQARRVAIARALLADRPILVMDEPTEGLDAATARSLYRALAHLMEGRTVILITHRLEGLANLVDERLTLRDGAFVAETPMKITPRAEVTQGSRFRFEVARKGDAI